MASETCDRCGNPGADRRTLWMACFYSMEELGLPFTQRMLFHANTEELEKASEPFAPEIGGQRIVLQSGTVRCSGELRPQSLYTLRVCKRCRGEWMAAIRTWFHATPEGEDHDADLHEPNPLGTGVFVRENGSVKELTEAEVAERFPKHG